MKFTLVLSLFLMLPMHAMETDTPKQLDSEKGIPELYKQDFSLPPSKKVMPESTGTRRKKIAAAFITLLAGASIASSSFSAYTAFEPVTHRAFPYTGQLPANNATCSYQETFAKTEWGEAFLPIAGTAQSIPTKDCYANQHEIPEEYCACENPPCKVVLETCQENDPIKKQIVNASLLGIVAQMGAWATYVSNVWHNN